MRSRRSGNCVARPTAAIRTPGASVGPHHTAELATEPPVSVMNGTAGLLSVAAVTGRLTTAWSLGNPSFRRLDSTTHLSVIDFRAARGLFTVLAHLYAPGASVTGEVKGSL